MARVERYRQYADNARKRSAEASAKGHHTLDQIPMGQPIITGRGSRTTADINRRDRAHNNILKAVSEAERADYWERRADKREHYEARLEDAREMGEHFEGVKVGDTVMAHFTNSGRFYQFRGLIVGRTVNVWKVKTLGEGAPYGEAPGCVFHIPAFARPRYSANNRVYRIEQMTEIQPLSDAVKGCPECGHPWAYHMHPSSFGHCRFPVSPDEFCGCEQVTT